MEPSAEMALQLPLFWPRRPQVSSRRGPTMAEVLDVWGVKRQANVLDRQAHAASLGVGGSVLLARNVEF